MPGLSPIVATNYQHQQTEASDTWTVVHNLQRYPVVDIYVDVDGTLTRIIPMDVTYVDANTCTISFSSARTGYASVV